METHPSENALPYLPLPTGALNGLAAGRHLDSDGAHGSTVPQTPVMVPLALVTVADTTTVDLSLRASALVSTSLTPDLNSAVIASHAAGALDLAEAPGGAGPQLLAFNLNIATTAAELRKIQDAFYEVAEVSEDVVELVDVFKDIKENADTTIKIIDKMQDSLKLVEKVGSLKVLAKGLREALDDMKKAAQQLKDKAAEIDKKIEDTGYKDFIKNIPAYLELKGNQVGNLAVKFEVLTRASEGVTLALDFMQDQSTSDSIDSVLGGPNAVFSTVNSAYDATFGRIDAMKVEVDTSSFDNARTMVVQMRSIVDSLKFLDGPLTFLQEVINPVKWALDAVDWVYDSVIRPVVDPVLEALGVNRLFDELGARFRALLPNFNLLDAPGQAVVDALNGLLPDGAVLPELGFGDL